MTEANFRALMLRARSLPDRDYSAGYQRGLRRLHHGERFGTDAEHAQWMDLDDDRWRQRRGYRDGYAGREPAESVTCSAADCDREARAGGLCTTHYQRARRGTAADAPLQRKDLSAVSLRLAPEVHAAIEAEAARTGESAYRVAQRWLEERATGGDP